MSKCGQRAHFLGIYVYKLTIVNCAVLHIWKLWKEFPDGPLSRSGLHAFTAAGLVGKLRSHKASVAWPKTIIINFLKSGKEKNTLFTYCKHEHICSPHVTPLLVLGGYCWLWETFASLKSGLKAASVRALQPSTTDQPHLAPQRILSLLKIYYYIEVHILVEILYYRQHRRRGFYPWVGKIPGEENSNPYLPGVSHRQRSLVGYSPRGHK